MQIKINRVNSVAVWRWVTPNDIGAPHRSKGAEGDEEEEEDVCGICRVPYDGCCPDCKLPGDDCPLIWGQCSHVFHMHCLIKWISQESSKQQCPMDRRPWVTASGEAPTANAPPVAQAQAAPA